MFGAGPPGGVRARRVTHAARLLPSSSGWFLGNGTRSTAAFVDEVWIELHIAPAAGRSVESGVGEGEPGAPTTTMRNAVQIAMVLGWISRARPAPVIRRRHPTMRRCRCWLAGRSWLPDRHFEAPLTADWYSMKVHIHTMTEETQ